MIANVTSGDRLNDILRKDGEVWIPFREAMERGGYSAPVFSNEFCHERSEALGVTLEDYIGKLGCFINLLENLDKYEEIVMWFGDENFCRANRKVVLQALADRNYQGKVTLHIVDETTGEIHQTLSNPTF